MNHATTTVRLGTLATALATLVVALIASAAPATAGLGISCPDATSQPFVPWSDNAHYAFLPDGGFEAGASGWTLNGGAKAVAGNERFFLHGKGEHSSLRVPEGGTATSPPMCISLLSSKMRFALGGATGARVKVQVLYRGAASTLLGVFDGGTVTSNGTWTPSTEIPMLGGVLPLLTASVQFRFVATNGNALIDDVYLDPWKAT